ncbi:MAG: FmdB family transcriptional regulator [Acidimicrobiales bacterium]|jgi:putative FmdB family regulatory protein|nr:FmdB family transcriptional regulator [Acidimicrobiales bacterium]
MPTYEYRCKDCGHELEAQQAFTDDPLTECPSCGGLLKKRFGSVGISFKGSGFYKNDARGSSTTTSSSPGDTGGTSSKDTATASSSSTDGGSTKADTPSAPPAPTGGGSSSSSAA